MGLFMLTPNKKAQAWSFDLVMATVIFMSAIIILFVYSINYLSRANEDLDNLFYEGNVAAELILSEDTFGIISGNQINQTKLDAFNSTYLQKRLALGLTNEFYFNFNGMKINGNPALYVGNKTSNADNEIQITRVAIYENKPVKFQLRIWE